MMGLLSMLPLSMGHKRLMARLFRWTFPLLMLANLLRPKMGDPTIIIFSEFGNELHAHSGVAT
jgi:hypothetical protein